MAARRTQSKTEPDGTRRAPARRRARGAETPTAEDRDDENAAEDALGDEPSEAADGSSPPASREEEDGEEALDFEPGPGALADDAEPDDVLPARLTERASSAPESEGALVRLDPLQLYMREVQQHALLTPEEEHDLATRYAASGDVAAAARLVTANLRLVVKLAYEYRRAYRNMMDLVQEGNIGLMQAVKRFDPNRGVKLSSYAAWWIRAYMLRFILNNWRLVKLGTTQAQRKLFFNLRKEKARLSAMGVEPTTAELAESLAVDEREVVEMDGRLASSDASLDAPVGDAEGRQVSRGELLRATSAGPDEVAERAELTDALRTHLEAFRQTLEGKEAIIFDERLIAEEPRTLQELGDRFGVSRERVRQVEARLTGRLRDFLRERLGDAVDVMA